MKIWTNRKIGLVAAIGVWLVCVLLALASSWKLEAYCQARECACNLKTLQGACEMYALDRNLSLSEMRRSFASPRAMQDAFCHDGYLREPLACEGRLAELGPDPRDEAGVEACCPLHRRTLTAAIGLPGEPPTLAGFGLVARLAAFVVFPFCFWFAAQVRCVRFGLQYRAGTARLIPASWALAASLLFAPAGVAAMGCFRQAIWQFAFLNVATFWFGWPATLTALPLLAWTAIVRYREER